MLHAGTTLETYLRSDAADAPDQVIVARHDSGDFAQVMFSGRHAAIADEPVQAGGLDLGPDPHKYVLMGLGTCTSMTLLMYARRKGWLLEDVVVRLKHAKAVTEPRNASRSSSAGEGITREILLIGPLTDEQWYLLMGAAERCPIQKMLSLGISITTEAIQDDRK